jgi:hypothetical protein
MPQGAGAVSIPAISVKFTPLAGTLARRGNTQQPESGIERRDRDAAGALRQSSVTRNPGPLRNEGVSPGNGGAQTFSGAGASNGAAAAGYGRQARRSPISDAERAQLQQLRARDREVRAHEAAHAAAGGSYAGSPKFSYQRGPDGVQYAVGGSVTIDVSSIPGDPAATLAKMRIVRAAALAPAQPSQADREIAARASRELAAAQAELNAGAAADRGAGAGQRVSASGNDSASPAPAVGYSDAAATTRDARIERALSTYREIEALRG